MAVPTIIILSVKGGSGKTLVALNVSYQLSAYGPVGLVDADIDSPHLPSMAGIKDTITLDQKSRFIPTSLQGVSHPIRVVSFGLLGEFKGKGITQSGSQHTVIIRDMIKRTAFGPLSYRVVDLPAGSGDELLECIRLFKNLKGIIAVAQPNTTEALLRVIDICKYHGLPLLGAIENMGGVAISDCCGERVCCSKCMTSFVPFPDNPSVERICKQQLVEYFGSVPLSPAISRDWKIEGGMSDAIRNAIRRIRA